MVQIPAGLEAQRALGVDWGHWLDGLAATAADFLARWHLEQVGAERHGFCSLVVPVLDADQRPAALKISFDGDDESEHEGIALQHWGARGAVELRRADPRRRALLLAWLPGHDLSDTWDVEACEIVAGLYAALHVPAPPQLRTVTSYVARWTDDLRSLGRDVPMPRRLVDQALGLAADLVTDPASTSAR